MQRKKATYAYGLVKASREEPLVERVALDAGHAGRVAKCSAAVKPRLYVVLFDTARLCSSEAKIAAHTDGY